MKWFLGRAEIEIMVLRASKTNKRGKDTAIILITPFLDKDIFPHRPASSFCNII